MARRYRRRRWFIVSACALAASIVGLSAFAWASARCYCTLAADHGKNEPVHVEPIPNACLVVNTPDPWRMADGELRSANAEHRPGESRDNSYNYEMRQAPAGLPLYIALKSRPPIGYLGMPVAGDVSDSTNRFALEIDPAGLEGTKMVLRSIRRATDEEWSSAYPLDFRALGKPAAVTTELDPPDFPALEQVSTAARWSARVRQWGGPKNEPFYYEFWYNPPTYGSANFSAAGRATGEVHMWGCSNLALFLMNGAVHGEAYFTLPISDNDRQALLCRTGAKPVATVPAEASLAGTAQTDTGSFDN